MELRQLIDPVECLKQDKSFQGVVSSAELPRLSELLLSPTEKNIAYSMTFSRDASKRCIIHSHVTAQLPVLCQRCGQAMVLPVDVSTQLCVVADDQLAKQLPADYEPLVIAEGVVSFGDIVEEELLLAVPMIPKHPEDECPPVTIQL